MNFEQDLKSRLLWGIEQLGNPVPLSARQGELRAFAGLGTQVTPGEFWTVVCFVRYLSRVEWGAKLVAARILAGPEKLLPENTPHHGIVPGVPDWEYMFHGIGCRLTHRLDGTTIDWDAHGSVPGIQYVDDWFFLSYLDSLSTPELPEARLRQSLGRLDAVPALCGHLDKLGLLVTLPYTNARRLNPASEGQDLRALVEQFCSLCEGAPSSAPPWIFSMVAGEWGAACELLPAELRADAITSALLATRRAEAAENWWHLWHGMWEENFRVEPLNELLAADPVRARALVELELKSPSLRKLGAISRAADEHDLAELCPALAGFLPGLVAGRLPPDEHQTRAAKQGGRVENQTVSQPVPRHIVAAKTAVHMARLLLRHGYSSDAVIRVIESDDHQVAGDLALAVLEYAPEHAPGYFRRVLAQGSPFSRAQVAAAMVILAEPWCRSLLLEALENSTDREETAEVRAALVYVGDPEAREALEAWEEQVPAPSPSEGRSITALTDSDEMVSVQMAALHDKVLALRGRVQ